jgi:hypothetical protein
MLEIVKDNPKATTKNREKIECRCTGCGRAYLKTRRQFYGCRDKERCKHCPKEQYVGMSRGRFTCTEYVKRQAPNGSSHVYLHVQCECGKEKRAVSIRDFKSEAVLCESCDKTRQCRYNERRVTPAAYFRGIQRGATKRDLPCTVALDDILSLLVSQENRCALSGLPISFDNSSCSLDRIDNGIGYVPGNIQWVHKKVQFMKGELAQSDFLEVCDLIAQR